MSLKAVGNPGTSKRVVAVVVVSTSVLLAGIITALVWLVAGGSSAPAIGPGIGDGSTTGSATGELTGSGIAVPTQEPVIRVRVERYRERQPFRIQLARPEQWLEATVTTDDAWRQLLRGPVTITFDRGAWTLSDSSGFAARAPHGAVVRIEQINDDDGPISYGDSGASYSGALMMHPVSKQGAFAVDVINHLSLEDYLPGVLIGELYSHWSPQVFAAQAIAARSFACSEIDHYSARRHFDVTNTQRSQMFEGHTTHQRAVDAARQTRGLVLSWRGQLVPAYYHSCTGGAPARAVDAIGGSNPANNIAPLNGTTTTIDCEQCPLSTWSIEQPLSAFGWRIAAYAKRQGNEGLIAAMTQKLTAIEIAHRNQHGRPVSYNIITGGGAERAVEMSASQLQRAWAFGDAPQLAQLEPPEALPSSYLDRVEIDRSGQRIVFHGRGHGHGVGMSQWGAQCMAENGAQFDEILHAYYPEARIEQAYGPVMAHQPPLRSP